MRVGGAIGHVVEPRAGHLGGLQDGLGLGRRQGAGPGADRRVQLRHIGAAQAVAGEARRLGQFGPADGGHQPAEDQVRIAGDAEPAAIGAKVGVGRRRGGNGRAGRLAHLAEQPVLRKHPFHQAEHAAHQVHVDDAALRRRLALHRPAGAGHRERGIHAGQVVADGNAAARRREFRDAGIGGEVAKPAHRLADRAEGGLVAVGAVLAVAADAGDHQARVGSVQLGRAEAIALQLAGAIIFHQGVGPPRQPQQLRLVGRVLEVERDAELVAAMHAEPHRMAVLLAAPAAEGVAARRFHLDHLGAEIGQQAGAEGRGDVVPQFNHLQPCQRQHASPHPARRPGLH